MGNLRKYSMTCTYSAPTGNTVISGSTTFSMLDAFSGTSIFDTGTTFSYGSLSLSGLSELTSVVYNTRAQDFISYVYSYQYVFDYTSSELITLLDSAEIPNFDTCFLPPENVILSQLDQTDTTITIYLIWDDVTVGEEQFSLEYRINDTPTWTAVTSVVSGTTSYINPITFTSGNTIQYRIRGTHTSGNTDWVNSNTITGLTINAPSAPTPLGISLTAYGNPQTSSSFFFSWIDNADNANNEDQYEIQLEYNGSGTWSTLGGTPLPANSTGHSFTINISEGELFKLRIRSINGGGSSSWVLTDSYLMEYVPLAPSNFEISQSISTSTQSSFILSWKDNSNNEDIFDIEYTKNGDSTWTTIFGGAAANETTLITGLLSGFVSGDNVKFRIRSSNSVADSAWVESNQITLLLVPSAPSDFVASWNSTLEPPRMTLEWNDTSTGEAGFRIERKLGSGTYSLIDSSGANSEFYIDYPTCGFNIYTYRIRSYVNKGNYSGWVYSNAENAPCSSCLLGDHSLMVAPDKYVNIKDLKIGDMVYTAQEDEYLNVNYFPIVNHVPKMVEGYYVIKFNDCSEIKCSSTHKFMREEGDVITAQVLDINDYVLKLENNIFDKIYVSEINYIEEPVEVYIITVEGAHTYISENNIFHHNKVETFDIEFE